MSSKPFHEATHETVGSGEIHYSEQQAERKAQDIFKKLKDSMGKKEESSEAVTEAAVFLGVMDIDQPSIPKGTTLSEQHKIYCNYYKKLLKKQGLNVNENACTNASSSNASGSRGCVVSGGRRRATRRRNLRKRSTRRNYRRD